jgi:hypothetical protein
MATYIVNAPNRHSTTVSCPLGTFTMNHASYMFNDALARYFPNIFVKVADTSPIPDAPAPVVVPEPVVVAAPVVTPAPVVEAPQAEPVAPVVTPTPVPEVKVRKKPGPKPKVKVV